MSDAFRLVFCAQPRTASRACCSVLRSLDPGLRQVEGHHSLQRDLLNDLHADGYRSCAAVRNHFDIVVSWYHWKAGPGQAGAVRGEPFDAFVYRFPTMTGNGYVRPHELFFRYQPHVTDVLRHESLWADLAGVLGLDRIDPDIIPVIGASRRLGPYRGYYTPATRGFVTRQYGDELRRYGYAFDGEAAA